MTDHQPRSHLSVLDRRWSERPLWQVGLAAAVLASAANVVLYLLARALGVPLELTEVFSDHFGRIPVQSFVLATLLDGGATGTMLALACRRWATHPRAYFAALAVTGAIASLGFPITSDATTATKIVLSISHGIAALVIVSALALRLPTRRPIDTSPQASNPGR
jgi:hypothetical protein